jgi:hypothetical protein
LSPTTSGLRLAAATKLLEGLQVFPKTIVEPPPTPPNYDERRLLMLGQIMDMTLNKSQRYGMPLPPGLEELQVEAHEADRGLPSKSRD